MSFSLDIKGLDKVQKALKETPSKAKKALKPVLVKYVVRIHGKQVQLAMQMNDRGQLVKGLGWAEVDEVNYILFSQAPYSAYREFGTGKKFKAIPGVDASQYKGSSGSSGKLYDAILAWVKRKGVAGVFSVKTRRRLGSKASKDKADRQAAFLIYREILTNGSKGSPFFFPPFLEDREAIKIEAQVALDNL